MCSRYVSPDQASIENEFDLVRSEWEFPANFNAAPSQVIPVIRVVENQPDPVLMRWGFGENGTFNVRIEILELGRGDGGLLTLAERCIVPAMGFYKWRVRADGSRRPYFVHVEDQDIFGFAGFWQRESCATITVPANAMMSEIDGTAAGMPAILTREMRDVWLYGSPVNAAAALTAYPADRLVAYEVGPRVDSLDNNDETLIEPLETDVD